MDRLYAWIQTHRWRALAGFVTALGAYVFVTALIPRAASAYGLYRAWQQHQARIAAVADGEAEQRRVSARRQQLQQRFATLYVSLPRSDHTSIILQVLQQSAETEQVTLNQVRPAERIPFVHYDEVPFQVELRGSFHGLGAFTNRIEQSPYVIKVQRLHVRRAPSSPEILVADLALRVVILKEQGAGL